MPASDSWQKVRAALEVGWGFGSRARNKRRSTSYGRLGLRMRCGAGLMRWSGRRGRMMIDPAIEFIARTVEGWECG